MADSRFRGKTVSYRIAHCGGITKFDTRVRKPHPHCSPFPIIVCSRDSSGVENCPGLRDRCHICLIIIRHPLGVATVIIIGLWSIIHVRMIGIDHPRRFITTVIVPVCEINKAMEKGFKTLPYIAVAWKRCQHRLDNWICWKVYYCIDRGITDCGHRCE